MANLSQNLEIVKQLTLTDFKLRYSGSVLGYLWTLLKPFGLFLVMYVVFDRMLRFGEGVSNFPTYLLIGIMLWNFFSEVTNNGLRALVGRADLLKKIYFPRIIIILVSSFSAFINLFFNLIVMAGFMAYFKIDVLDFDTPLVIPLLLELWAIALGLALILSILYVKFRDLSHIWELILQVAFYLTPIIYPLTFVPARYQSILLLNPVAQIITDFRAVFINFDFPHQLSYPWPQVIISLVILIAGYLYFNHEQKSIAEEL